MYRTKYKLLTGLSLLLAGCGDSEADACGQGQVYRDGACEEEMRQGSGGMDSGKKGTAPSPGGADSAADNSGGGEPAVGGGADAGAVDPAFGAACEQHTDCKGPTDYCVASPLGAPYCSASGCDADASICPEGWTCFDVSKFAPGEPFICAQPPA
ncbi:MAG: hypothetical protein RJA70_3875 [Pseudomonadota bacterium]|jgi:hypothetical protein